MQRLQQLADQRATDERILAAAISSELSEAEKEFETSGRQLNERYSHEIRTLENEFAAAHQAAAATYDSSVRQAEAAHQAAAKTNDGRRDAALAAAEHHAEEAQWQANTVFEAHKDKPIQLLEETTKRLQSRRRVAEGLARDAQTLMSMRGQVEAAAAYDWRRSPASQSSAETDLPTDWR